MLPPELPHATNPLPAVRTAADNNRDLRFTFVITAMRNGARI
ncbi:MAG TPA: hypothetical protein VMG60_19965 [Burkholderiaceae bacterium]|nr:hypothetical protein [Burkholderiaceae bacterium]